MKGKIGLKIFSCTLMILFIVIFSKWNSELNKNTRYIENKLSEVKLEETGTVKDLFDLDYDILYVFRPYESKAEMEEQIGFKDNILKETVNEGMVNVLLVKENSPVTYLYGYPSNIGYYIDLPVGSYTKQELDSIRYTATVSQVEHISESPKIFTIYKLHIYD